MNSKAQIELAKQNSIRKSGFNCPKCDSLQVITERRPNGKQWCKDCGYVIRKG